MEDHHNPYRYDPEVVYERRYSSRKEGVGMAIGVSLIVAAMIGFVTWLTSAWWEAAVFILFVLAIGGVMVAIGIYKIIKGGHWYCRLTRDRLACRFPTALEGEDFDVPVDDITAFVVRSSSNSRIVHHYIRTRDGTEHDIKIQHYHFPGRFLKHLQSINPQITREKGSLQGRPDRRTSG